MLAVFVGALMLFFALGGQKYVSFEAIKQSRETLLEYTEQHYALVLTAAFLI